MYNITPKRKNIISEINVTPFIDIMLVLLVVFMITSPMMMPNVQVDLPKSAASSMNKDKKVIMVTVNKMGEIYLQGENLHLLDLKKRIAEISSDKEMRVFIRADKNINYGKVMQIMNVLQGSGFKKVALVTSHDNT